MIELVQRGELFTFIYKTGPLSENTVWFYLIQLVEVLQHLHSKNVAHRDLKPENLLLDLQWNMKVADFGFATIIQGQNET